MEHIGVDKDGRYYKLNEFNDAYWLRYFCARAMEGLSVNSEKRDEETIARIIRGAQKMLDAIHAHENNNET